MEGSTVKKYKCNHCGHVKEIETNHFGKVYSIGAFGVCPKCPPFRKYPQYGGSTIWVYVEPKAVAV